MNEPASHHDFWNYYGRKKAASNDFWHKSFEWMAQMKPSVDNVLYRKGSLESKDILTKFHLTYSSPLYFALLKKNTMRQLNNILVFYCYSNFSCLSNARKVLISLAAKAQNEYYRSFFEVSS